MPKQRTVAVNLLRQICFIKEAVTNNIIPPAKARKKSINLNKKEAPKYPKNIPKSENKAVEAPTKNDFFLLTPARTKGEETIKPSGMF